MLVPFEIETRVQDNYTILVIRGDITTESDEPIGSAFNGLLPEQKKNIVFDLSQANYINSAGIASFISILHQSSQLGGKLAMACLNDHFKRVMETVGLTDFIQVFDSVSQAGETLR